MAYEKFPKQSDEGTCKAKYVIILINIAVLNHLECFYSSSKNERTSSRMFWQLTSKSV